MTFIRIGFTFLFLFVCSSGFASAIDSVKLLIKNASSDSIKVLEIEQLDNMIYASNPDLDFILNMRIDSICTKNLKSGKSHFFKTKKAMAQNYLGIIYINTGSLDSAEKFLISSKAVYAEIDDTLGVGLALMNQGRIEAIRGNYPKALSLFEKSASIMKDFGDDKNYVKVLHNMAIIYEKQGNSDIAISYFKKTNHVLSKKDDLSAQSNSLMSISLVYKKNAEYIKSLEYGLEARKLLSNAHDIRQLIMCNNNLATIYIDLDSLQIAKSYLDENIGFLDKNPNPVLYSSTLSHYASIKEKMGEFADANMQLMEAIKLLNEMGLFERIVNYELAVSNNCLKLNKLDAALLFANSALKKASNTQNQDNLVKGYELKYLIYKAKGNFEEALKIHEKYMEAKDDVKIKENSTALIKFTLSRDYEKKALADSLNFLNAEKLKEVEFNNKLLKEKSKRKILIGVVFVILFFTFFAVRAYRNKRRDNKIITLQKAEVEKERKNADNLLLNILPKTVANELKQNGVTEAKEFEQTTILFTDFKDFTNHAKNSSAKEIVSILHDCFKAFDLIVERNSVEKIKTIGDAYFAVGGVPVPDKNHAYNTVAAALEIRDFMETFNLERLQKKLKPFQIRVGINSGSVVAGVVGVKKFAFDIWGNNVNVASRMESESAPGKVNISRSTYEFIKDNEKFVFESRGLIKAKGLGEVDMYFVDWA